MMQKVTLMARVMTMMVRRWPAKLHFNWSIKSARGIRVRSVILSRPEAMTERRLDTELQQFAMSEHRSFASRWKVMSRKRRYQNTSTDVQNTTIASWYINSDDEWYSAWLFNFSAPLMILATSYLGHCHGVESCVWECRIEKRIRFLGELLKMAR